MDPWTILALHRQGLCELQREAACRRLAKIAVAHARGSLLKRQGQ